VRMKSTMRRRLARLERVLSSTGGPEDRAGRFIASLFAWLIAFHLGGLKPGVEPPSHGYARALGYGEPRNLLEAMIKRPDEHIERDAEARARLLATEGVDLATAGTKGVIVALERLTAALPEVLRSKFTRAA
jgi:hypothetical protein